METQRYPLEEIAQRGDEIYEQNIRVRVENAHEGKVVAIDIETGAYALGDNAVIAARQLRSQYPLAEVWFVRVGDRALHRLSSRPRGSGR
ncbi:MAG: hypothetical protein GDA44_07770 [Prochloron sp. SP5CPC1]|nr:hypothetical protein [Candidatus Paraprochloron terpiosi SP5CPC1]